MKIIKLISTNRQEIISQTLAVLKSSGLVVFPSDTVYGLLVDAQNPEAVTKLLAFKERVPGKAISVFVADKTMAKKYVKFNQNTSNVVNNLFPGPFTVIAQSKHQVDSRLEAENGTLGFRIPDYPLILELVKKFGSPLTATSANLSGQSPNYSITTLLNYLSEKKKNMLDLIVDAGKLSHHKPSTVIDTTTGQLKTLRIGNLLPKTANSFISQSEEDTKAFGRFLASKFARKTLSKPLVFLLKGELGTGKTVFTKGLAEALLIKETIISPTYTIAYEYPLPLLSDFDSVKICHNTSPKLIHYDLYRLDSIQELEEIGLLNNPVCGNIYVIEWPERIPAEMISALKGVAEIVFIQLQHSGSTERLISWACSADK